MQPAWRDRPVTLYYVLRSGEGLFFGLFRTMQALFLLEYVGVAPHHVLLLGTAYEATAFLAQLPTGMVADRFSRRLSFAFGFLLSGSAYLCMALWPSLAVVLAATVLWGLGEAFVSGARDAWVADEITHSPDPAFPASHAFTSGSQWQLFARIIGTWLAVPLAAKFTLAAPVLAAGAGMALLGILSLAFFPEKNRVTRTPSKEKCSAVFQNIKSAWTKARASTTILAVLATLFIVGFASEPFDRLWQELISSNFELPVLANTELTWWALLNTSAMLLTLGILALIKRSSVLTSTKSLINTILVLIIVTGVGLAAFGLAPTFAVAAVAFLCVRTVRRCFDPILIAWLNQNVDSQNRATMLSFAGQVHSFGEILAGPSFGPVVRFFGTRFTMVATSLIVLPGIPLLLRQKSEAALAPETKPSQ